jgi:hypothetical protein
VNKGRDTRISIGGDQIGNMAVGGSVINVSGVQETLDSSRVPDLMAKLDAIVRLLEAYREETSDPTRLLNAARAATEEISQRQPRRRVILARLTDISSGIAASASLVAALGPLVDAAKKLLS